MKKLILFSTLIIFANACSRKTSTEEVNTDNANESFVLVKGGTFVNTKSNLYGKQATLPDFYIGKHEVTQKDWTDVMESNPSKFKGDTLPVETVSWYDCISIVIKEVRRKA